MSNFKKKTIADVIVHNQQYKTIFFDMVALKVAFGSPAFSESSLKATFLLLYIGLKLY